MKWDAVPREQFSVATQDGIEVHATEGTVCFLNVYAVENKKGETSLTRGFRYTENLDHRCSKHRHEVLGTQA